MFDLLRFRNPSRLLPLLSSSILYRKDQISISMIFHSNSFSSFNLKLVSLSSCLSVTLEVSKLFFILSKITAEDVIF